MTIFQGTSGSNLSLTLNASGSPSFSAPTAARTTAITDAHSWYEAMAKAWGQTLDAQATRITELSGQISEGGDQPSSVVQLTAESMRMQFLSNNASTSQNSVGQALETLGKRQ